MPKNAIMQERYQKLTQILKKEQVKTWFDLGLFLDQIKDNRPPPSFHTSYKQFMKNISNGIGFLSFDFGIDGVSIEAAKYVKAFEKLYQHKETGKPKINWIGGHFYSEIDSIIPSRWNKIVIPEIGGFSDWDGYQQYFHTHLERGNSNYNELSEKIWMQVTSLCLKLGEQIVENNIQLLIPLNVSSNPGNVALAYALVLLSEYMDIPVLCSHHDFYWDGGKRKCERVSDEKIGVRDHFFKNDHLGEVFALIEMLYPWDSKRWFHTCINNFQRDKLIEKFGINPISIGIMPTIIDSKDFRPATDKQRNNTLRKLHLVFSNGHEHLTTIGINKLQESDKEVGRSHRPLLLGFKDDIPVNFAYGNLIFLQPTRIIKRKRIEINFLIIEKLLKEESFSKWFKQHQQSTITLLVTGPAAGQENYYKSLLDNFRTFFDQIPKEFRERIFLAFPFGLEDKSILKNNNYSDLTIKEVYSIASLVLLPSETEGRGLPILESCSTAIPLVCNRYEPEYVFEEVVGENLEKSLRLDVFKFKGNDFPEKFFEKLAELFINPYSYKERGVSNREIIKKRFSLQKLVKSMESFLETLWIRSQEKPYIVANIKNAFKQSINNTKYDKHFHQLVRSQRRRYLPGFTQTEFMIYLKSLIDPSFFRLEEMELKSRIMLFGVSLIQSFSHWTKIDDDDVITFFKHLDSIFEYHQGSDPLAIDHSLSYRHRHRRHYPYRKLTEQELCGIVGIIFRDIFKPLDPPKIRSRSRGVFKDIESSLCELVGQTVDNIAIDDRDRLIIDLNSNKEIIHFGGKYIKDEVRIFVLDTLKRRLGLAVDYEVCAKDLTTDKIRGVSGVTLLIREQSISDICYDSVIRWINHKALPEIKLLYKSGLFKVIPTKTLSVGIHLGQLGREAMMALLKVKESGGFAIAFGNSSFMLDMIDIPTYRLGKIRDQFVASFMGLEIDDAYIQWVPSGLKPCLAYPTPIQTPRSFSKTLKSKLFKSISKQMGEKRVLEILGEDADRHGTPIQEVLENIANKEDKKKSMLDSHPINGIYQDGLPWSGAYVKVSMESTTWKFVTTSSSKSGQTVLSLIEDYQKQVTSEKVSFAWNGGYILNPELVGKLGLPETYIGSPLGLISSNGKIQSLPLYNKAAFLIKENGKIEFQRVNLKKGLTIKFKNGRELHFDQSARNRIKNDKPAFYDLLFKKEEIIGKKRVIYRFVNNRVIERIADIDENIKIIPVGLTISLPIKDDIPGISIGDEVSFEVKGLEDVVNAIEAGPMLLKSSEVAIDMEIEGWKTTNSISTQAARLDYTDMRGPKIGVGITKKGDLVVVAINGRIRESVGATHIDLANILKEYGCVNAMGFDPGGSVTLVAHGKQLNISPYNSEYELNWYSLPPRPRTVGNAVLGINKC